LVDAQSAQRGENGGQENRRADARIRVVAFQ
jgi:hypothetical protein